MEDIKGTRENSYIEHCERTYDSSDVKVENVYFEK
jgi:hypothetical protein